MDQKRNNKQKKQQHELHRRGEKYLGVPCLWLHHGVPGLPHRQNLLPGFPLPEKLDGGANKHYEGVGRKTTNGVWPRRRRRHRGPRRVASILTYVEPPGNLAVPKRRSPMKIRREGVDARKAEDEARVLFRLIHSVWKINRVVMVNLVVADVTFHLRG